MNIICRTFNNTQVVNVVKIRISFGNGLFCILEKPVWYLSTNQFRPVTSLWQRQECHICVLMLLHNITGYHSDRRNVAK